MFNVSVIIINFNSLKYILKCIDHLLVQKNVTLEIIIVDNHSSDNSLVSIKKKIASNNQIKLLELGMNLGSSAANNAGIRLAKYESVLILNADVFLEPYFIFRACKQLYSNPRIGTVVGKLLSSKNHNIIDSIGIKLFREGIGDDIGMGEFDNPNSSKSCIVYGACCAAALYKIDMLNNIAYNSEYYDESFFAYNEDLDLSIRSFRFGWHTYYVPDAVGYHVRGGSTAKYNSFINFLTFRNLFLFQIKHFHHADPISFILNITYMILRFIMLKNIYKLKFLKTFFHLKDILEKRNDILNRSHHDIDFSKFDSYLLKKLKKVF